MSNAFPGGCRRLPKKRLRKQYIRKKNIQRINAIKLEDVTKNGC